MPELKLFWDDPGPSQYFGTQQQQPQKIFGSSGEVKIGRGPSPKYNDLTLLSKRISNRHCKVFRLDDPDLLQNTEDVEGLQGKTELIRQSTYTSRSEPIVVIEDLNSSNGTWVNSKRLTKKHVLKHGDEISLGAPGPLPAQQHDVRWIYKSVSKQGVGDEERVGEIFERFTFLET